MSSSSSFRAREEEKELVEAIDFLKFGELFRTGDAIRLQIVTKRGFCGEFQFFECSQLFIVNESPSLIGKVRRFSNLRNSKS